MLGLGLVLGKDWVRVSISWVRVSISVRLGLVPGKGGVRVRG